VIGGRRISSRSGHRAARLVGREVELDARAVGIVEEHLPHAGLDLPATRMRDVARREQRERVGEVGRRERDVIDHARRELARVASADDVQHGMLAGVEPRARHRERRPRSFGEAEQVRVEADGAAHVVGEDREVIHSRRRHVASDRSDDLRRLSQAGAAFANDGSTCIPFAAHR
jgi:hypothetical protein